MKIVKHSETPPDWDNNLLQAGDEANFLQTTYWATLIQRLDKARPIYLEVRDGKDLVASLMVLHKIAYNRVTGRINKGIRSFLNGTYRGWLDLSGGPVFYSDNHATEALDLILQWISEHSQSRRLSSIYMSGFNPISQYVTDEKINGVFISRGYIPNRWATYLVDLTPDENSLWKGLEHSVRKNVNKARRNKIRVENIRTWDEFAEKFYVPYLSCTGHGGNGKALAAAKQGWSHPGHDDYYRYYVAVDPAGHTLGMLGMFIYNNCAAEIMSAMTKDAYTRRIPVQDLLHWEMFLKAKQMGCRIFDLAGVSPRPTDKKGEGIRRFKEKWGGRLVKFNTYRKENFSGIRKALISANKLRKKWS